MYKQIRKGGALLKKIDLHQIKTGYPDKMGATVYQNGINFATEIPMDQDGFLLIYDKKKGELLQEIPFAGNSRVGEIGTMFIEGMKSSRYEYAYRIGEEVVLDPYAIAINDGRCALPALDMETCTSDFELPWIPFEELIMYKIHVKGFTKLAGSSVKKKGTFRGLEESIPYLLDLGINAVEFMPMYHWMEDLRDKENPLKRVPVVNGEELKNYWGYAPTNYYFAPKAEFASTKDPVKECKQMIDALHDAGMECIMEVYFPEGTKESFVLEVLSHWKLNYGVDGFHLQGNGVPKKTIAAYPILKKTKLFFDKVEESWVQGKKGPVYRNIAEYNDAFMNCARKLLKGDEGQISDFAYQIRKNYDRQGTVNYMANVNGFTMMDMVSYSMKHNEANGEENKDGGAAGDIWNWGEEGPSRKKHVNGLRKKQLKNAMLYTLLSQGTPLIYQGDEFGNSQNGNNNAYAMDNEIGWVNWKTSAIGKELHEFVKEAIAFRKEHPILHMEKPMRMADYKGVRYPDLSYHDHRPWYPGFEKYCRSIACMYCGKFAVDEQKNTDDFIYIAYNSYWKPCDFALPKLPEGMNWQMEICTDEAGAHTYPAGEPLPIQNKIEVPARSVVVLIGK